MQLAIDKNQIGWVEKRFLEKYQEHLFSLPSNTMKQIRNMVDNYLFTQNIPVVDENIFQQELMKIDKLSECNADYDLWLSEYEASSQNFGLFFHNGFWLAERVKGDYSSQLLIQFLWKRELKINQALWDLSVVKLLYRKYIQALFYIENELTEIDLPNDEMGNDLLDFFCLDAENNSYDCFEMFQNELNMDGFLLAQMQQEMNFFIGSMGENSEGEGNVEGLEYEDSLGNQEQKLDNLNNLTPKIDKSVDLIKDTLLNEMLEEEETVYVKNKSTHPNSEIGLFRTDLTYDENALFVQYDRNIAKNKELKKILELLGRKMNSKSSDKKSKSVGLPQSEPLGIQLSNQISTVLASELALLGDDDLNILFDLKFLENQLLSFELKLDQNPLQAEKSRKKGPIILCIDTSASMGGKPEQLAKIIVYYIACQSFKKKRPCYLINFSIGTECLDIRKKDGFKQLVNFLKGSFGGGTDIEEPLMIAMDLLYAEDYKNADILVVSDFYIDFPTFYSVAEKIIECGASIYGICISNHKNHLDEVDELEDVWYFDWDGIYIGKKDC